MSRQRSSGTIESRAMLRRPATDEFLIVRAGADEDRPWEFPGGPLEPPESPEAALRRNCRDQLGIELEILIGQPPFRHDFATHSVTYRYYECLLRGGAPAPRPDLEIRWVQRGQLRDYHFDKPTQDVVNWLLGENRT